MLKRTQCIAGAMRRVVSCGAALPRGVVEARRGMQAPMGDLKAPLARDEEEPDFKPDEKGKVEVDGMDYTGYVKMEEFKETKLKRLHEMFGEGAGDLYRALYRELADELRRERYTKPPAPNDHIKGWTVEHKPNSGWAIFRRTSGSAEVVVGAPVTMKDPKTMNEVLTFLNWFELDVMFRRDAYVLHWQVAVAEMQLYPRNFRAYHDPKHELMKFDAETDYQRFFRRYDGPYFKHMEMDVQTEIFDMMLDVGLTSYAARYLAEWVAYFEHCEYVRWLLKAMDAVAPDHHKLDDERDVITLEERRALDEELEEWRDEFKV